MIKQEDVTIIIPHLGETLEQKYALTKCLESLGETFMGRVIVATNGNSDSKGDVHVSDQGQCKAVNAAVATTNTPWIMVSNDDMVYPPEWFERLVGFEYPMPIRCVSPKLVEPRPGAPTFEVMFAGGAGGDFDKGKWLEYANEYKGQGLRTGFNTPFLINRELWDTIGGYDINYDPWGSNSDSDLEYKIMLAGVQPMQNTNAIVYHFSQTSGTFEPRNQAYWHKNFAYFQEKWGFPRTDAGIWEASFAIPDEGRTFRPDWEGKYGTN